MRTAAVILYSIGVLIELAGALLVVRDVRAAHRAETTPGIEPGPIQDTRTRWGDIVRLRSDLTDVRARLVPSWLAVALLIGGIAVGFVGNLVAVNA